MTPTSPNRPSPLTVDRGRAFAVPLIVRRCGFTVLAVPDASVVPLRQLPCPHPGNPLAAIAVEGHAAVG